MDIEGFDGFTTKNVKVAHVHGNLQVEQRQFNNIPLVEVDLPSMNYDVILGKPWFTAYNPQINWRDHTIERVESDPHSLPLTATSVEEPRKYFLVKASRVVNEKLPKYVEELLLEFAVIAPEAIPPGLPPRRDVEFEIKLKPGAKPSNRAPFRLSKMEEDALDVFVQELLKNKWIELSNSPWVSNVFGIPKKDPKTGKFPSRKDWLANGKIIPIRWVIDYRYLNQNTEIPRVPLPNMNTIFDKMVHAIVFTTMDLLQGYHQMGVKMDSRKYTAFRSKTETYQWCVAPMGVAGMPSIWSRLMNQLFGHLPFVVVYLDDLCIFSKSHEEHAQHLRVVFEILKKNQLYIKKSKCAFARSSVEFLGHLVSAKGVQMDDRKVSAIVDWPTPRTLKEVQSFLGLAGYYRRFIPQFAEMARPLSHLAKKSVTFTWTSECTKAFQVLKTALQQAPVLRLPDFEKRFVVATDASKYAIGGVLSQRFEDGMHPVAYFSKTLGKHELNWSTYEKELFAIKMALEKWRHYLYGVEFDVYTDNSACSWFLQQSGVTGRLARWLVFFSQYNFRIHHLKGTLNVVPDALSRVSSVEVCANCDDQCQHQFQSSALVAATARIQSLPSLNEHDLSVLLDQVGEEKPNAAEQVFSTRFNYDPIVEDPRQLALRVNTLHVTSLDLSPHDKAAFIKGYQKNGFVKLLRRTYPDRVYQKRGLYFIKASPLDRIAKIVVPDDPRLKTRLLAEFHDGASACHPGAQRTYMKLSQWYHWNDMHRDPRVRQELSHVHAVEDEQQEEERSTDANANTQ